MSKPTAVDTLKFVREAIQSDLPDFGCRVAIGTIVRAFFDQCEGEPSRAAPEVMAMSDETMLCAKCIFSETAGPGRYWCIMFKTYPSTTDPVEECVEFHSRTERLVPLDKVLAIVERVARSTGFFGAVSGDAMAEEILHHLRQLGGDDDENMGDDG